jgi:thiosulfate dehydrogenase [quinone] large subunit
MTVERTAAGRLSADSAVTAEKSIAPSGRRPGPWATVAALLATAARVALGILWINEALLKWHAGFGKADILLVVHSTAQNPRVPGFYKLFTADALGRAPALFGFGVPLIEFGLGVALILGVLTLPAALASVAELCNYWLADQLIAQYPIMMALSAAVIAFPIAASRYSVTALLEHRRGRPVAPAVRRWL